MGFVKNIFNGEINDFVHNQFVRFGKGNYEGRALISLHKTSKIKIKSSFEFCNDFVGFVSELGNYEFSGVIISREEIKGLGLNGKKTGGAYQYNIEKIESEKIKEIKERVSFLLLNVDKDIKLKIKKKLPKPGKSADKVDDKFCQLELDLKFWGKIKEEFFWDLPECKKAKIKHTFLIENIVYPQNEKDFEKIRLLSKRKGKIIRNIEVDGKGMKKEVNFEA